MNDWTTIFIIYLSLFISSPLIVALHELGHAFAYLIFTNPAQIDIYIGSYGINKGSINFKIGKLNFYLKRSYVFVKSIGLCRSHKGESNYKKYIVILLAGSLFTLFASTIPIIIVLNNNGGLYAQIICYIFLGLSSVSLLTNLFPFTIGSLENFPLESDGKQILFALKIGKFLPYYVDGRAFLEKKDFEGAFEKFKYLIDDMQYNSSKLYRVMILTCLNLKRYEDANRYMTFLERGDDLQLIDTLQRGILQSFTKKNSDAITTYNLVLKKDKNNLVALNNIGFELAEKGEFEVSKYALEKAIKLRPDFEQAYGNLGYLYMLQGNLEVGKSFINKCLLLNPKNADAYKTLGIYYFKVKNFNLSKHNFDKAVELDSDIDLSRFTEELESLKSDAKL